MKKLIWLLLITVTFVGCGKENKNSDNTSGEDSTTAENRIVPSSIDKAAKYDLKYKFKKGDRYDYALTTITNTNQTVSSDTLVNIDVIQTIKYKFAIDILSVSSDKIADVSINIGSIDLKASYNGQTVTYNSNMVLPDDEKMQYLEYETLKNSTYKAKINDKGQILNIYFLDKIIERMAAIQKYEQKLTDQEKAGVAENLSALLIKPLTQHLFRILPEKEVAIDSSWQYRYPSSLATFQIENIASFRLANVFEIDNNKIAEFSAALNIKASGDNTYTEKNIHYYFDKPVVTGSGTIRFNIDTGQLVNSNTTTRIETQGIVEATDDKGKTEKASRKDITVSTNIIEII